MFKLAVSLFFFAFFIGYLSAFEVKLEHHVMNMDDIREIRAMRLEGRKSPPPINQKLLEAPYINDYILANISFGTPLQTFSVMISTGSTRVWILSPSYPSFNNNTQHVYEASQSKTSTFLNKTFNNEDGSYNVSGTFYSDFMQFGSAKIDGQGFGVVDQITDQVHQHSTIFPADGVLGLNHLVSTAYKNEPNAPIDNLLRPLIKKIYTIWLDGHQSPSKGIGSGKLTFGSIDTAKCDMTTVDYVSLVQSIVNDRYVFSVTGLNYGTYASNNQGEGYVDIGMSTLNIPSDDLFDIYQIILPEYDWDNGLYTVNCSIIPNLTDIEFGVNGSFVSVPSSQYVVDIDIGGGKCALAFSSSEAFPDGFVSYTFGTPFARSLCQIYDFDKNQIGFTKFL